MAIRVGVVGVGVHGLHHVRILSTLPEIELAGIFDIRPAVCETAAAQFRIRPFSSLTQLLDSVDCVTVAVPTSAHHEVVLECLGHDRSVLVEKPIAVSTSEADDMIREADKRRLTLAVGHLERFNAAYRSIQNELVKPAFVESHRLSVFNPRGTDVAVVLDLMIHDIDIVLDMVRRPVVSVHASGVAVVSDEADIANARIRFEGGCVANLTASRISQRKMRKVRIFQRNAYISMDFLSGETEMFSLHSDAKPEASPGVIPQLMNGISYHKHPPDGLNALELEFADFIHAVRDGTNPRVTGTDGRNALEVASQVMESMELSMRSLE
ncbi:MAG: Gfo/Idh/MocA family oxidoreductase [Candidatus Latescibacter sp.]|nr:Gfo/Idh/MocA family oxidoreductase [Candidatus Latescibacter sp.]